MVKELVYSYAMWITPAFHLKVIRGYDAMVTQARPEPTAVGESGLVSRLDWEAFDRLQRRDPSGRLGRVYLAEQGVTEAYVQAQLERAPILGGWPATTAPPIDPHPPACEDARLGRRVEVCLRRLGWTRADLARRVPRLTEQVIHMTIRRNAATSKYATRLAEALGVPLRWLLDGPGTEPKWLPGRQPHRPPPGSPSLPGGNAALVRALELWLERFQSPTDPMESVPLTIREALSQLWSPADVPLVQALAPICLPRLNRQSLEQRFVDASELPVSVLQGFQVKSLRYPGMDLHWVVTRTVFVIEGGAP